MCDTDKTTTKVLLQNWYTNSHFARMQSGCVNVSMSPAGKVIIRKLCVPCYSQTSPSSFGQTLSQAAKANLVSEPVYVTSEATAKAQNMCAHNALE